VVAGSRPSSVVVVGAGLAGLVCARTLADRGVPVVVVDRRTVVGGRLATTTVDHAVADTGAQFFTIRSDAFQTLVDRWRDEGCPVREWSHGFLRAGTIRDHPDLAEHSGDGHPRYAVDGGMAALAAHVGAGLDVRLGREVEAVSRGANGWRVTTGEGATGSLDGSAVVCTAPAPETLAVLAAGHVDVPEAVVASLQAVTYEPCVALVAMLDRPPAIPAPGGVQCAAGSVTWLADNRAKGLSDRPSITVHAAGEWSAEHWAEPDEVIADGLLEHVHGWLGGAVAEAVEVHRWRYARTEEVADDRVVVVADEPLLAVAGDGCGGPKVEGAARSGLAAAERVLAGRA
jgi:renalase